MKRLIAHLLGDYVVQSDYLAQAKTSAHLPAVVHGASYAACFLPLTRDWRALAVIGGTHAVIDRYRLARYLVWGRNQIAPADRRYPLAEAGPFGQRGRVDAPKVIRMARTNLDLRAGLGAAYTPEEVATEARRIGATVPLRYDADWLHGWLLFTADNAMHMLINEWALDRWSA